MEVKVSADREDEVDELVIKMNNLLRNMIYSAYREQNLEKAIVNGEELKTIVDDELKYFKEYLDKNKDK